MRRRRQSGGETSSMELLLDTMCNTFGGIVFITLMIALITSNVRLTMHKSKHKLLNPALANREIMAEIARRQTELQELSSAKTAAGKELQIYQNDHILRRSGEYLQLRQKVKQQQQAVAKRKRQYLLLLKLLKNSDSSAQVSASELKILARTVHKLQVKLDKALKIEKILFTPPLFRSVAKRPVFISIKGDQAYIMSRLTYPYYLIEEKCDKKSAPGGNIIYMFKDFSDGIAIYPITELQKKLSWRLGKVTPQSAFISCEVYQDSFKAFIAFRKVIKAMGYTYNWSPLLMNEYPTLILTHGHINYQGQ